MNKETKEKLRALVKVKKESSGPNRRERRGSFFGKRSKRGHLSGKEAAIFMLGNNKLIRKT